MRFTLDSIPCAIHAIGPDPDALVNLPIFISPAFGEDDETESRYRRLDAVRRPCLLATFAIPDWNDALSPWPAPPLKPAQPGFGGNAPKTLAWILTRLLPAIEANAPAAKNGPRGILGYSLAGLFALWAITQTDAFTLCGSCSGSLWYEGFTDYLEKNEPRTECAVYLSLGEREERARNPRFARVGAQTRRAKAILDAAPRVRASELVWHPGGHGDGAEDRISAALAWLAFRADA